MSAQEGTEFEFNLDGYQPSFYMINKRSPDRVFVELIPVPQVTIDSLYGAEIFGAAGGEKLGEVPYTELIKEVERLRLESQDIIQKQLQYRLNLPLIFLLNWSKSIKELLPAQKEQ